MSKPDQSVTPMMAQFLEIKEGYPSALLFYRMGDFYELFFDDAVAAAKALDITLTKRGKHQGADIPMCGVPVHAAEGYLLNLIRKGFRVAVCEQLENPQEARKRGTKSVVKRGVVRLVTPGTLTEDTLLHPRESNFLASFVQVRNQSCLSWVDISTGDLRYSPCPPVRLGPELARLAAAEVLVAEGASNEFLEIIQESGAAATELPQDVFDSATGADKICKAYGVGDLSDLGEFGRADIAAISGLIEYLSATQKGQLPLLRRPVCEARDDFVAIDAATRKNLELTQTLSGERSGSLLSVVDRSVTAAGARLLFRRITTPSQRLATIEERASAVAFFCGQSGLRGAVRSALKQLPDVERALGRVALERSGPRDLLALGNGIIQAAQVHALLAQHELPPLLHNAADDLKGFEALSDELDLALVSDAPLLARDGGFVAAGYSSELDEITALRDEARSVIARMQADYANQSGIPSLKIKHNNVLGYFIETTATHAQRMMATPLNDTFIHRQTTANAVRFTTVELGDMETKILNAAGRATGLELEIFAGLCAQVLDHAARCKLWR